MMQTTHSRVTSLPPSGGALSESAIVEHIYAAVMDQRLPPGTKLSEKALCERFGVSRMRIRRVLLLLAAQEIVKLHSNRGAFVSSPSAQEARHIFQARRAIEPAVMQAVIERISAADIDALLNHVAQENCALVENDRQKSIHLSGHFHVKLAQIGNNPVLTQIIQGLVTRTSLIIGLFGDNSPRFCSDQKHRLLIEAIAASDGVLASRIMYQHLCYIENKLNLKKPEKPAFDLLSVL